MKCSSVILDGMSFESRLVKPSYFQEAIKINIQFSSMNESVTLILVRHRVIRLWICIKSRGWDISFVIKAG